MNLFKCTKYTLKRRTLQLVLTPALNLNHMHTQRTFMYTHTRYTYTKLIIYKYETNSEEKKYFWRNAHNLKMEEIMCGLSSTI